MIVTRNKTVLAYLSSLQMSYFYRLSLVAIIYNRTTSTTRIVLMNLKLLGAKTEGHFTFLCIELLIVNCRSLKGDLLIGN